MDIRLWPGGRRGWLRLTLRWSLLGAVLAAAMLFVTHMPGRSFQGPSPPLESAEIEVRERLRAHVWRLAGDIGERNLWHYSALEAAASYMEESFSKLGYVPVSQVYQVRGKAVRNIEVSQPGSDGSRGTVVVGAHYDSVLGSPGANDNASGAAGLLEIARLLRGRPLVREVRLVAFVNEEPPFYYSRDMGSVRYAQRARERGEHISAMLSLETIGHYSHAPGSQRYPWPLNLFYPSRGEFIGFVTNLGSRALVRRAIASFRRHTRFPSEGVAAPGWLTGVGWSDHWSFWKAGYPAIMVTDTALFRYAHYHAATDTPDRLDYESTARVVSGLARVIEDLAGSGY